MNLMKNLHMIQAQELAQKVNEQNITKANLYNIKGKTNEQGIKKLIPFLFVYRMVIYMATVTNVTNFNKEAKKILENIQKYINQEDTKNFKLMQYACDDFLKFYKQYYEDESLNIMQVQQLENHVENLKNMLQFDGNNNYSENKINQSIQQIVLTNVDKARKLETLLTGFKTMFLKFLGYDFIQQIVIETEEFTPIIIELQDFSSMQPFIKSATSEMQGKLKDNQTILDMYNTKLHNEKLYSTISSLKEYQKIYSESRRRLNIFWEKIGKGHFSGEGFLFYKPQSRWKKFYVNSLGDLKQGYISMSIEQPQLSPEEELNIEIFTTYIGKVDNIRGTLLQDVQNIKKQISSKSGSASTGSHKDLIDLITLVRNGNISSIQQYFNKDLAKSRSGKGQRNYIYEDNEAKNKIAEMMSTNSLDKAEKVIKKIIQSVKSNNIKYTK